MTKAARCKLLELSRALLLCVLVAVVAAFGLRGAAFAADASAGSDGSDRHAIIYATDDTQEQIDDDETALSAGVTSTWSIVDFVCAMATMVLCCVLLGSNALHRNDGGVRKGRITLGAISVVPALVGVVVLALTQDFAMPASMYDELSALFMVLLVIQLVLFAAANLGKNRIVRSGFDVSGHDATGTAA